MEDQALLKAVEVGGTLGAIVFMVLYFWFQAVSEKIPIASKTHTPILLKWFLAVGLVLGMSALTAWYLSGRNSVTILTSNGRISIDSSVETKLPPINIDSRSYREATNIDPLLINRVEDQAIKIFEQATSLEDANQKLTQMNLDLTDWQFLYFEQAHSQSIEMFRDLSALRNYRVTVQAFNERWSSKVQGNDIFEKIFSRVLVAYGWVAVNGDVISITTKGKLVLSRRGGESPAFPISENLPNWCSGANTWVEHQICSDTALASAEVRLLQDIGTLRLKNGTAIDATQATWRKNIRDKCPSIDCLREAYQRRISYFATLN